MYGLPGQSPKPVGVSQPSAYSTTLRRLLVLADVAERRESLLEGVYTPPEELG